jgi:MFS transporter, DHA1 family, multidrug resistance protein
LVSWKRNMWILWAGVVLCSSSYTMCVPFLPLFLYKLGVNASSIHLWSAMVFSSSFLVGAVMGPLWGAMADKFGKRKMVIRAGISLVIIYALFAFVQNPWELFAVRLLHGFFSGFIPASMAIVASTAPEEKIGSSLGFMQAGTFLGSILGPLIGGVLSAIFGMRLSFIAASAVILIASLAVVFFVHEGRNTTIHTQETDPLQPKVTSRSLLSRSILAKLSLLFVFQLSLNALQPIITLHIVELKGQLESAVLSSGLIFSLVGVAGIIASPLWGQAGPKWGARRILQICMLSAGSVIFIQFFVHTIWLFALIQFIFGLFMAGIVPTVNTMIVKSTSANASGRSFGLTASANQLGGMMGPIIGGVVGLCFGNQWVFVAIGIVLVATGLLVRYIPKITNLSVLQPVQSAASLKIASRSFEKRID